MIDIDLNPDRKKLRGFGWIAVVIFGLFGGFLYFNHGNSWQVMTLDVLAVIILICNTINPLLLKPLYLLLTLVSFPIGLVVSNVVLFFLFIFVFTPTGLLLRVFGHDPMEKQFHAKKESFWIESKKNRSLESYYKQF